jgi:hypothetical protein
MSPRNTENSRGRWSRPMTRREMNLFSACVGLPIFVGVLARELIVGDMSIVALVVPAYIGLYSLWMYKRS